VRELNIALNRYGAESDQLIMLDADGPEVLPYSTLIAARNGNRSPVDLDAVVAVYEWQDQPLMFIVEGEHSDRDLRLIRRVLSMRGDAPYMGVLSGGTLRVVELGLDKKPLNKVGVPVDVGSEEWATFGKLAAERSAAPDDRKGEPRRARGSAVSGIILKLLNASIKVLRTQGLTIEDSISFVGRALFARFLADRSLLTEETWSGCNPEALFDTPNDVRSICVWLDEKFNGNLLPISDAAWHLLNEKCCHELGNMMRRAPDGQLSLDWKQKWDYLDFSHIPVGVLSQAYEHCLERYDPLRQKEDASYYTPSAVADLLTKAAFRSLQDKTSLHEVKVLDPAVGAGVFLIKAYSEIAAARWKADGHRPDTTALREILHRQLTGFDVNEAALRFAALGLYLAAIELDPSPEPVEKLRFENLRETTLYLLRDLPPPGTVTEQSKAIRKQPKLIANSREEASWLGSLGPLAGAEHDGRYDLVVGNPPWSKAPSDQPLRLVNEIIGETVGDRIGLSKSPKIPENALDQAFLWRATRWAKKGGCLAFAMHARLLFQNNERARDHRKAVFAAIDPIAVINGADVRGSGVWPKIDAPFCLIIAHNRKANPVGAFNYVSPKRETGLNAGGLMRIDALNSGRISNKQVQDVPTIFKALFRGSQADLEILQRVHENAVRSVGGVWADERDRSGGELLNNGGFQTLRPTTEIKKGETERGDDGRQLFGMPMLISDSFDPTNFDVSELPLFYLSRLHRRRSVALYSAPILLALQSPPVSHKRLKTLISERNLVFSESFYGWQLLDDDRGRGIGRYLSLLIGSKLCLWYCLMTGGKFGVEREAVELKLINQFPVPEFDASKREEIDDLFGAVSSDPSAWERADQWVAKLYGLSEEDVDVIVETLAFNLTYTDTRTLAEKPVPEAMMEKFLAVLKEELSPWFDDVEGSLGTSIVPSQGYSAWRGVVVSFSESDEARRAIVERKDLMEGLHRAADRMALSQIIKSNKQERSLQIAKLNQARYWTRTQARALATDIILTRLDDLKEEFAS